MARSAARWTGRLRSAVTLAGLGFLPACASRTFVDPDGDATWLAAALILSVSLLVVTFARDRRRQRDLRTWQSASTEKDRFLASVSHELRTPLTAIIGMLDLLVDGRSEIRRSEFDEFLLSARQQGYEMSRLLDDYVIAGRLSSHALTLRLGEVDLDDATGAVIQGVDLLRGVKLHVASPLGQAVGDPLRIRQIARNLVRNAVRYATTEVRVETLRAGDTIHLEVKNDGPAVDPEMLDKLFKPFVGTGRPGQPDSLGLGLAISQGLARRMGGDLTYQRRDGWTVFSLSLPTTLPADTIVRPAGPDEDSERPIRRRLASTRPAEVATGLALVVQPIIDLRDGRVAGFETLARVVGENGRVLHWPEAIAVYEPDLLQSQAVERALQLAETRPKDTFLTLNVDTDLIADAGVVSAFAQVPDLSGLVLELSTAPGDLTSPTMAAIDHLRSRNAQVAIGDQGVGIPGLLGLRPDFVKIGKDTVTAMGEGGDSRVLMESIGEISSRIDAQVVAEGVERSAQLDTLFQARIRLAQGYLLARPAPPWPAIDSAVRAQLGTTTRQWAARTSLSDLIVAPTPQGAGNALPSRIVLLPGGGVQLQWLDRLIDEPLRVRITESRSDVLRRAINRPVTERFSPVLAMGDDDQPLGLIPMDVLIEATLLGRTESSSAAN